MKVALSLLLPVLALCLAFWILVRNETTTVFENYQDSIGQTLSRQSANTVREMVLSNDLLGLKAVLSQLSEDTNISNIIVYDIDENILATAQSNNPDSMNPTAQSSFVSPITVQGALAGSVEVQLNSSLIEESKSDIDKYFWIITIFASLLSVIITYLFLKHENQPIVDLLNSIEKTEDNSDFVSALEAGKKLSDTIAGMQTEISTLKQALAETKPTQYQAKTQAQAGKQFSFILVCQPTNISTAIDFLHPNTLRKLIAEYSRYFRNAVRCYGGTIVRDSGDSMMASFQSASDENEYKVTAIKCAVLFQSLVKALNQKHYEEGKQVLEYQLGISCGNTFSARRMQEGNQREAGAVVMGKAVEIANFLASHGKKGKILISEKSMAKAQLHSHSTTFEEVELLFSGENESFTSYLLNPEDNYLKELVKPQFNQLRPENQQD